MAFSRLALMEVDLRISEDVIVLPEDVFWVFCFLHMELMEVAIVKLTIMRWQLPEAANTVSASTANESRQDTYVFGKPFAVATSFVFGGAALVFRVVASKLELQNMSDIKTKGKDYVEPELENIKEQFVPLKIWAEKMSSKWHMERDDVKQKTIIKEMSKIWGAKRTD